MHHNTWSVLVQEIWLAEGLWAITLTACRMLMPVREGGNHGGIHGGMARLPSSVSNFNYFLFPSPHLNFI
jgi:hypothetical protein